MLDRHLHLIITIHFILLELIVIGKSYAQTSFEMTKDKAVTGQIEVSSSGDKGDLKPTWYYKIFHNKYRKNLNSDVTTLTTHTGEYVLQKIETDSIKEATVKYKIYEGWKLYDRLNQTLPETTIDKLSVLNNQYAKYHDNIEDLYIQKSIRTFIDEFLPKIEMTHKNITKDIDDVKNASAKKVNRINTINDLLNIYQDFVDGVGVFYDNLLLISKYRNYNSNFKININYEEIANSILADNPHF